MSFNYRIRTAHGDHYTFFDRAHKLCFRKEGEKKRKELEVTDLEYKTYTDTLVVSYKSSPEAGGLSFIMQVLREDYWKVELLLEYIADYKKKAAEKALKEFAFR